MKTIILDRDGVINENSVSFITSHEEWLPIAGSIEAMAQLSQAGFRVAVATNQSGVARGLFDELALSNMHNKLRLMVEDAGGRVDGIFYCPHAPDAGCECRKPATGLLQQIEREFAVSLQGCWFVGDSLRDLQAGQRHGCQPVLVRTGSGLETERGLSRADVSDVLVFDDLASAANHLLEADNS
ncbi:MAG: D-glycero-beta-D-manno-heptose 1,7-bisphosphate 7-phosphatase [Pseudohongiellaceae bacterium]